MSLRAKLSVVCAVVVLLFSTRATAEPVVPCKDDAPCHLRMREPTTLIKDNQESFRLPPGRFFREDTFISLDVEMKRLQDSETRLKAENKTFRDAGKSWQPGWFTLSMAVVLGAAAGVGGYYWYENRD